ncbi:MAG TPA: nucleoside deaminase [Dongiaceae bacterium]|jgi:tRNA(Arg) A34 adenosine deaminase TadA|nr:nucleoside deaminase [Dongiaceae bacterium]
MTKPDFMALAFQQAEEALRRGEVPVGAVIVERRSGLILSQAGNRTEEERDPTAHAEIVAIRDACRKEGLPRLPSADLYVTLEPCTLCVAAISLSRIGRLFYAARDPKGGAVEHGVRFFTQPTCHHRPVVLGGLDEARSADLLRRFFVERRD